jgi:hypothetical protein
MPAVNATRPIDIQCKEVERLRKKEKPALFGATPPVTIKPTSPLALRGNYLFSPITPR